jgi:hypothetical protein
MLGDRRTGVPRDSCSLTPKRAPGVVRNGDDRDSLDRHAAARIVRRVVRAAGFAHQVAHTPRHCLITAPYVDVHLRGCPSA